MVLLWDRVVFFGVSLAKASSGGSTLTVKGSMDPVDRVFLYIHYGAFIDNENAGAEMVLAARCFRLF